MIINNIIYNIQFMDTKWYYAIGSGTLLLIVIIIIIITVVAISNISTSSSSNGSSQNGSSSNGSSQNGSSQNGSSSNGSSQNGSSQSGSSSMDSSSMDTWSMHSSVSETGAFLERGFGAWTIVNASTGQALQWDSAIPKITIAPLTTPTTADNQKWFFPLATPTTSYISSPTTTGFHLTEQLTMSPTVWTDWILIPTTSTDGRSAFNINNSTGEKYLMISNGELILTTNASSVTDASKWIVTNVSS